MKSLDCGALIWRFQRENEREPRGLRGREKRKNFMRNRYIDRDREIQRGTQRERDKQIGREIKKERERQEVI